MVSFGHERDANGAPVPRRRPEEGNPAAKISKTVTNFIRRLVKMKNTMKKLLCMALVIMLLVSAVPAFAMADDGFGDDLTPMVEDFNETPDAASVNEPVVVPNDPVVSEGEGEGEVAILGKARGSKNGNNMLIQQINQSNGIDFSMPYSLAYSGLSDVLLQKYVKDSSAIWEGHTDTLPVSTIGATIGTHAGPGAIAVSYFECK